MFSNHALYYKFSTECAGEKILTIGQYLTKIWTKLCGILFSATLYTGTQFSVKSFTLDHSKSVTELISCLERMNSKHLYYQKIVFFA